MSTTIRIAKLEKTIRTRAKEDFIQTVDASFASAISRAAANESATKLLTEARNDIVRKGQRAAEEAALEEFLAERAPEPRISQALIRLDAAGKRLSDADGKAHIAVLVPGHAEGQDLLIDARAPGQVDSVKDAPAVAAAQSLYDGALQLLSDAEWGLVIDRRYRDPAVHPFFSKTSPTDRWYPTRTPLMGKNGKPNGSGCVWAVALNDGYVNNVYPLNSGFVRGCRLAPAGQF